MTDATITTEAAVALTWDVLVIGAGPAGAAAALRLAWLGRRVLLTDRNLFPRPKVCGCCLSPAALRELALLDLRAGSVSPGVPLEAVWIGSAGSEARIDATGGATLSREKLDSELVRAAIAAGAAWLPGTTVAEIEEHHAGAVASVRGARNAPFAIHAKLIVIAAGLADAIRVRRTSAGQDRSMQPRSRQIARASLIGLGTTLPADVGTLSGGELVMAVGRPGYAGIVRLEDGRIDVAAAIDAAAVSAAGSPALAIDMILAEVGGIARRSVPHDALATAAIRATPPLTHTTPLTSGTHGSIVRIGDAAAYVEPFTGEGIGWALASARVLASTLECSASSADFSSRFAAAHASVFAAHHARCRRIARAVRRPWLLAGAVQAARLVPALAARAIPWVVGGGRLA